MRALLVVFLLVFDMDDFEAVVAMLEVMLLFALLDVVLEELRDLHVLVAVVTGCNELTLFSQMQVQKILVLEVAVLHPAVLAS